MTTGTTTGQLGGLLGLLITPTIRLGSQVETLEILMTTILVLQQLLEDLWLKKWVRAVTMKANPSTFNALVNS